MILILSKLSDGSTNRVIDWLLFYEKEFFRINGDDKFTRFEDISETKIVVSQGNKKTNILNNDFVWFRRGAFSLNSFGYSKSKNDSLKTLLFDNENFFNNLIKKEFKAILDYIYSKIENSSANKFSSYFKRDLNKLTTLEIAKEIGFKTPGFFITNSIEGISNEVKNGNLITKAIRDGVYLINKDYGYYSYTERISKLNVDEFSTSFFPSLFQKEIKKKYELRVFYLNGKTYSTVIFSQGRESTRVDHRKYSKNPLRHLPYNLPAKEKQKIKLLMNALNLKIGAIDLIIDQDDEYIFLEVNPVGQFSYYSDQCNYYIEKDFANEIIKQIDGKA